MLARLDQVPGAAVLGKEVDASGERHVVRPLLLVLVTVGHEQHAALARLLMAERPRARQLLGGHRAPVAEVLIAERARAVSMPGARGDADANLEHVVTGHFG